MQYVSRMLLHGLIACYVAGAFMWAMPAEVPMKSRVERFVAPVFYRLGLWQSWDMFAPTPRKEDIYTDARVRFADGSVETINLACMWKMSLTERYRRERWRKFFNDHIRTDMQKGAWPRVAQRIAADAKEEYGKTPVHVELWRHWRPSYPGLLAAKKADQDWSEMKFFESTPSLLEMPL